jgi:hypothetical protein
MTPLTSIKLCHLIKRKAQHMSKDSREKGSLAKMDEKRGEKRQN